jgi:excisionase family DNA binding protein
MTEEQVADYLAFDVKKLRRLRYDGKGPTTLKIGNLHRIRREDLLSWMAEIATS